VEPVALATAALSVIVTFLTEAATAAAKDSVGKAAVAGMKSVYQLVKDKLVGDPKAKKALLAFEDDPGSKKRQAAMLKHIEQRIKDDATFSNQLQKLLPKAEQYAAQSIRQNINVTGRASTGDINQIGNVDGSIDLGKKR
jgi:hypothetical protein